MSDKKPMVLVLAGPNGLGKSTITPFLEIVGTYTNADDIVSATGMSMKRLPFGPITCGMIPSAAKKTSHSKRSSLLITSWISLKPQRPRAIS